MKQSPNNIKFIALYQNCIRDFCLLPCDAQACVIGLTTLATVFTLGVATLPAFRLGTNHFFAKRVFDSQRDSSESNNIDQLKKLRDIHKKGLHEATENSVQKSDETLSKL
jgi:hypothetical protein